MVTLTAPRRRPSGPSGPSGPAAPRRRRGRWFGLRVVAAVIVSAIMLFPVYYMIITSVSQQSDLNGPGLHLWPEHFTWSNFSDPIEQFPVWNWVRNSTVITVAVTVITVVCNLLAGYAFAKIRFRGRNALFLLLLSTLMIPVQAVMVAQYKLAITLGLYGNVWSVVLPESATVFGVFLARQFFLAVPDELIEAARVDGAGAIRTFRSIVLPLCKPLIAVLTLLTALGEWNAYSWPLVALFGDDTKYTLPLGMTTDIQGQFTSDYPALMAINLLMVAPMIVLFIAFQRYFVQGLARSGIR
jgi:multiple sugar transport system permease protein